MWRPFGPYAAALLLTGAPTALAAQNAAALSGRILDAVSGKGITNATVAVTTSGASARTDSLGRFRIDGLRPGIHRFLVSADGYARGAVSLA
ncbi:MAG: carboxypeptidase-like regulatory domain-containing protein, partial [Gemmatimonas sp.]